MPRSVPRTRQLLSGAIALALLAAGWALAAPASPAGRTAQPATLAGQLDAILSDSRLSGAEAGLTVRDADNGQLLYDANGNERLLPASNAKVFSSVAAMDLLGPGYRFRTAVLRSGRLLGHTLLGELYLKGYGDPTSTAADYDALAAQVAATGVRFVDGALVADDSYFDADRLAPFWSWDDEPYYYSAQTSALDIAPDDIGDTGTILINVLPAAQPGERPTVNVIPANHYVRIANTATTGAAGSARTIQAVREHGRNVVDVTGSIPAGSSSYASQPTVDQPTGLAAEVFAQALARHGVRLRPGPIRYQASPATAVPVAEHQSAPLQQLLIPFLKLSNNMMAEALTKAIGQQVAGQGSWAAGTAAILSDAAASGVGAATLQLFDGSGLGRADYLTTDQLTSLLLAVRTKPWFAAWYDALPIAGNPAQLVGGTLRNRLTGTPAANNLHGKTGSMTGVSALSGYLTDAGGHHLVFSMISNNFVTGGISHLEDAVALTLATSGQAGAGSASPSGVRPAATVPADTGR
ncbi:MAG: D-alanyl-D-alanine carboxypeptidase/D-alanyl-D-alanine-endopeptidase, partial [Jatrophihabitantaceae bacterium]